jgi:hypothetical protein
MDSSRSQGAEIPRERSGRTPAVLRGLPDLGPTWSTALNLCLSSSVVQFSQQRQNCSRAYAKDFDFTRSLRLC